MCKRKKGRGTKTPENTIWIIWFLSLEIGTVIFVMRDHIWIKDCQQCSLFSFLPLFYSTFFFQFTTAHTCRCSWGNTEIWIRHHRCTQCHFSKESAHHYFPHTLTCNSINASLESMLHKFLVEIDFGTVKNWVQKESLRQDASLNPVCPNRENPFQYWFGPAES